MSLEYLCLLEEWNSCVGVLYRQAIAIKELVVLADARARNPSRTQGCNDPFTFIRRYLPSTFLFHHDHKFRCRAIEVYLAARKGRLHLCPCFQPLSLSSYSFYSLPPALRCLLFSRSRPSTQGPSISLIHLVNWWLNYKNSCNWIR